MANFASRLTNTDSGTVVGLLTAAGVYLIYSNALPSAADVRVSMPNDNDVATERKHAAWWSAGFIGAVFLISRDVNSYIISGIALIGIDYLYKHSNMIHPGTGKLDTESAGGESIAPEGLANAYPMPEYATE